MLRDKFKQGSSNPDQTESSTQTALQVAGVANSYASFVPESISFNYFQDSSFGIENSFANGAKNSVLDFYVIQPYLSGGSPSPAPLVGAFRIDESAVLMC